MTTWDEELMEMLLIQDILLGYLHTEATVVPSIQAACMQVSRNWLL